MNDLDLKEIWKNQLNDNLIANLKKISFQLKNPYGWPEFDPLRNEISKCLLFDLCQASITLTNHLLENFLKTMLVYHESIEVKRKEDVDITDCFKNGLEKYDHLHLNDTLGRAKSKGIISKADWKILDRYREDFRNAYSHANKKKIFKNYKIDTQHIRMADNGQLNIGSPKKIEILELVFSHGLLQEKLSKENAFPYFIKVDEIIRRSLNKFGEQKASR